MSSGRYVYYGFLFFWCPILFRMDIRICRRDIVRLLDMIDILLPVVYGLYVVVIKQFRLMSDYVLEAVCVSKSMQRLS
jgi:hypothetical protein